MPELRRTHGGLGERIRPPRLPVRPVRTGGADLMPEPQPIGVIICGPYGFWFRAVAKCPKEGKLRRMLGLDEIYHGLSHTCLGCGTHWQENFSFEVKPYEPRGVHDPNWRIKARKKARATWKTAKAYGGPEHTEWYEQEMKEITG